MNKIIGKAGIFFLLMSFMALAATSCRKEAPTIAKIKILDTANVGVANIMVRLYPDPTIDVHGAIVVDDTAFTDFTGVATFDFSENFNLGQAGVFVLDIEARDTTTDSTRTGSGIIKIEEEITTEETVILQ